MDTGGTVTEISTDHKLNFKELKKSHRQHSIEYIEYAKPANASESDFAFNTPSF